METFDPSQHPTFVGSFYGRQLESFLHSHRLDAKWESYTVRQIQPRGEPFATGERDHYLSAIVYLLIDDLQLSEVMSGVEYLHGLSIVHGDLKGVNPGFLIHFLPY